MTPSTIFRMYSMTKPITGADVMTPVDAGKISLDDPASKHITEFKDMKVLIEKRDGSTELVPAERPIMLKHLMTHTDDPAKSPFLKVPSLDEGGGGLVCTAADYLRLAQMLLNGENWMASAF